MPHHDDGRLSHFEREAQNPRIAVLCLSCLVCLIFSIIARRIFVLRDSFYGAANGNQDAAKLLIRYMIDIQNNQDTEGTEYFGKKTCCVLIRDGKRRLLRLYSARRQSFIAYGHTTLNTPVLVRSLKLSNVGLG